MTAAALMVGVALVTFASVFAGSAKSTFRDAVTNGSKAQAVIQNTDGFSSFTPQAAKSVATAAGRQATSRRALRPGQDRRQEAGRHRHRPGRRSPTCTARAGQQGDDDTLRRLGPGTVIVGKKYAEDNGTKVGDALTLQTSLMPALKLKVIGISYDKGGLTGNLTVANSVLEKDFGFRKDALRPRRLRRDPARRRRSRRRSTSSSTIASPRPRRRPTRSSSTPRPQQIDQVLLLIYALLAMAIIVSLFGIVNTLVLSIAERTREIGLLRAIGMSRRQVRRMIRYEAIITAQIGAVIGLVLGIVLSILVTRAIDDFQLSIPIGTLIALLIATAIAGVFAAILPARRASKLDVLESLAYE